MAERISNSAKKKDNEDSSTFQLVIDTPHTQRVRNSPSSIQIQMKLAMLGDQERNTYLKNQINAFSEKVRLCQQSYSSQLAESMISQLRAEDGSYIKSIYQLKRFVTNAKEGQPTTVYVKWFLNNMEYLKDLKTNFDERIYLPLTKMYQNEEHAEKVTSMEGTDDETISTERVSSAALVLKFKNDLPEVGDLYDFTEVENMASRLAYIRQRWQLLLEDENEINATLFSYNSQTKLFTHCPKPMVNILRLVPDILSKCRNAALLSQQWLECACRKAIDLETKYTKLERVKSVLTEKLTGLSEEIKSEERELEAESTDLEMLADREERPNEMMTKTHKLDLVNQQLRAKIHHLTIHAEELKDQRDGLQTDDATRQDINKVIHDHELQILQLHQEIKMNIYEKELLDEDLSFELEVKPCMIRFTDQIQEKCEQLEQVIDDKRTEKKKVESALVPVLADSQRTQDQMSRVNSVASIPRRTNLEGNKPETSVR